MLKLGTDYYLLDDSNESLMRVRIVDKIIEFEKIYKKLWVDENDMYINIIRIKDLTNSTLLEVKMNLDTVMELFTSIMSLMISNTVFSISIPPTSIGEVYTISGYYVDDYDMMQLLFTKNNLTFTLDIIDEILDDFTEKIFFYFISNTIF